MTRLRAARSILALGVLGTSLGCGEGQSLTEPPVATQLAFSVQPGHAAAGVALSPAVQVEIQDASGMLVPTARDAVTLAIGAGPGGGTLSGTRTVNAVHGIATFSGLAIDMAGTGYTLVASSGRLTGATSSAFDISPGAVAQLSFTTQPPASVEGNVVIAPAVEVTLRDAFGNLVPTGSVTIGDANVPWPGPGSRISGTVTADAATGVATFANLRVDKPGRGYTLVAASGSATGTSSPFGVTLAFSAVSSGGFHTCGLTPAGTYCWGGIGFSASDSVPVLVSGGLSFVQVSAGEGAHSCGRTSSGALYCWGANGVGQLGNGSTQASSTPVLVSGSGTTLVFTSVSAGEGHTCASTSSGAVYCWGRGGDGQLGNSANSNNSTPVQVTGSGAGALTFGSISAGADYTCGVATGDAAYCWGQNSDGRLGNGANASSNAPVQVSGSGTTLLFASVSTGGASYAAHSCGATTGGRAYCWGTNGAGQLGNGATTSSNTPVLVEGIAGVASVSTGDRHTCAVADGVMACWGNNSFGQLGDGTTTSSNRPISISPEKGFAEVSAGTAHTCGREIGTGSAVFCWGHNSDGQLGDGSRTTRHQPVRVVQ